MDANISETPPYHMDLRCPNNNITSSNANSTDTKPIAPSVSTLLCTHHVRSFALQCTHALLYVLTLPCSHTYAAPHSIFVHNVNANKQR